MSGSAGARANRALAWSVGAVALVWLLANAWDLIARLPCADRLDHSVGVYVVLAELARQGVVYPAQQTPDLVYCTFYQPLGFLPYAWLPGSGIELLASMRALVRLEVALCLALLVALARRAGVGWWQVLLGAGVALSAAPVGAASLTTTDDPRGALFAALALWFGMSARGELRVLPAAGLLVLAFFTKLTAPCAAGVALWSLAGWWQRPAWRLLGTCAVLVGLGYVLAHAWLGWDLAGNGLRYALFDAKPGRALAEQCRKFASDLVREPVMAGLLLAAVAVVVAAFARRRAGWADWWFAAAFGRAWVEYHSHGTELNHLFEPCLAATTCLLLRMPRNAGFRVALVSLAMLCATAWFGVAPLRVPVGDRDALRDSHFASAARVLAAQPPAPTLTEAPLLGWLAGQRPVVTDPFLAGVVLAAHPEIRAQWFGDSPRALQRLVLLADPERSAGAEHWYRHLHFDAQFLADVRRLFRVLAPIGSGAALVRR